MMAATLDWRDGCLAAGAAGDRVAAALAPPGVEPVWPDSHATPVEERPAAPPFDRTPLARAPAPTPTTPAAASASSALRRRGLSVASADCGFCVGGWDPSTRSTRVGGSAVTGRRGVKGRCGV